STTGAFDTSSNGGTEGFVVLFDPSGNGAADRPYATYLGGTGSDNPFDVVLYNGDLYVSGYTSSTGFPISAGTPFQSTYGGGAFDGFATQLDPGGNGAADLIYST